MSYAFPRKMSQSLIMKTLARKRYGLPLLILLMLLPSCSWLKRAMKPEISLENVIVKEVSLSAASLVLEVKVENPNLFDITLKGLDFNLYLNDSFVGKGLVGENVAIKRRETTIVPVPFSAQYQDLWEMVRLLLRDGPKDYRIQGTVTLDTFFWDTQKAFDRRGKLKLKGKKLRRIFPSGLFKQEKPSEGF